MKESTMKQNTAQTGIVIGIMVLALVVIGGIFAYQSAQAQDGMVTIGVSDPSTAISGVSDVSLELKKVEFHSPTKGWITAATDDHSYNLLTLNASGKTELYTNAQVPADTYDRVRVTVGDVKVQTTAGATQTAIKPSDVIVFNSTVHVVKSGMSYVKLDFIADQSLHTTTTANEYVFAPVVAVHTESNTTVNTTDHTNVVATGGTVDSDLHVGVDLDGQSKQDFVLNTNTTASATANTSTGSAPHSGLTVVTAVAGQPHFVLSGHTYVHATSTADSMLTLDGHMVTDIQNHTTTSSNSNTNTNTNTNTNVNTNTSGNTTTTPTVPGMLRINGSTTTGSVQGNGTVNVQTY